MTAPTDYIAKLRQEYGFIQSEIGAANSLVTYYQEHGQQEDAAYWKWRRTRLNRNLRTILFELHKIGQLELAA